ncbi:MAG: DUF4160 domain-containing protein [Sphingobacteriales bacterium]|nr:DUF4160 domain-containing protein [Sphingobacteriales bacterium]MBI3718425.1 DUF4160 domain-containing protein [Sphingobacteriales bacterium]
MPTLLLLYGFRFFFYSNENKEPIYVHVTKGDAYGKIWLEPEIEIVYLKGFSSAEEKQIVSIINDYSAEFKIKWNEYFKK